MDHPYQIISPNSFQSPSHQSVSFAGAASSTMTYVSGLSDHNKITEVLSAGHPVAAVKSELSKPVAADPATVSADTHTVSAAMTEPDKDFLCPICMQLIKDVFLTASAPCVSSLTSSLISCSIKSAKQYSVAFLRFQS